MQVIEGRAPAARSDAPTTVAESKKGGEGGDISAIPSQTDLVAIQAGKSWFQRILMKIELQRTDSHSFNSSFTNYDLLPVSPEKRTWGKWTYSLFWFGECASVTSWTVAATGIQGGLSWWESWICVVLGHLIVAVPMVMTGRPGAAYNCPYPIISRASFGVWGSYWPVLNRNIMTIIWTGVQGVTTGNCIYVMLHAIFPSIARVPNPFSSDVTMTGGRLIGYSLGWLICLSFCFIRPQKLSGLVLAKSGIMIVCLITFFAWSLSKAHGIGPIIYQGASIPVGSSHTWVFLNNLFVQAGNMATFALNNADIARYARRPNDAVWTQLIGMPLAFGVVAFFGTFVTSASKPLFGKILWDPTAILDGFLSESYDSKTRAGVFFIALGFSFAQCTTMIFANIIAAGNDTSAMLPKYINYRRGAIICLVLAFAITPWNLTKTSFSFTSYLGSYQVFLASIIGVVISDYFFVRRGRFDLVAMFSLERGAAYYYTKGWNFRAYAAYVIGIIPVFPGFLKAVGVESIPTGAKQLYTFSLPVGIIVAGVAYWGLNIAFPPAGGPFETWSEPAPGEVDQITHGDDMGLDMDSDKNIV